MTKEAVGDVVGVNLKRLRGERDLSQAEVTNELNMHGLMWTRDQISQLENGRRASLVIEELIVLSLTFGVPLTYWFEGQYAMQLTPQRLTNDIDATRQLLAGKRAKDVQLIQIDLSEAEDLSADETIAMRLGIETDEVVETAKTMWGHTATAERDSRLAEHAGKSPKELRTLRGGMTKRLRREIEEGRGQ